MKHLRDIQGIPTPKKRVTVKSARAAGFRAGQSPTFTNAGFICIAVAVIGWFVLLHTPLIWPWTIVWLLVLVGWAAVYWTVGDSDEPESQRAQSTPGFDPGSINQQTNDVIHEHDHH